MKRSLHWPGILLRLLPLFLLAGCPAMTTSNIRNEMNRPVAISYDPNSKPRVMAAGETIELVMPPTTCWRIDDGGAVHEFQSNFPKGSADAYYDVGVWKVTIATVIAPDGQLYAYVPGDPSVPRILLPRGC